MSACSHQQLKRLPPPRLPSERLAIVQQSCTATIPGGERELAARVKKQGRSANVKLGNEALGIYQPPWPGTPRDLSEKEQHECGFRFLSRGSCLSPVLLHSMALSM